MLIEMHSHVIRNVDDGPQDNAHMFALLAQAASQGTRHLICTSHITPGYKPFPNTAYLNPIGGDGCRGRIAVTVSNNMRMVKPLKRIE